MTPEQIAYESQVVHMARVTYEQERRRLEAEREARACPKCDADHGEKCRIPDGCTRRRRSA